MVYTWPYSCLFTLFFHYESPKYLFREENVGLPTFEKVDCPKSVGKYDLCVAIHFDDPEKSQDIIMAKKMPKAPTVLKGRLKSNGKKAVIILRDDYNVEETVGTKSWRKTMTYFILVIWSCDIQITIPFSRHFDSRLYSNLLMQEDVPGSVLIFSNQVRPLVWIMHLIWLLVQMMKSQNQKIVAWIEAKKKWNWVLVN